MARNSNSSDFREILSEVRSGNLAPVYILEGEEAYYIDAIVDAMERSVIPEADRDFDQSVFYGNDADPEYVVAAARQFPVVSGRRLVILKEAQSMEKAKTQLEKFASYVENPSMTTIFVIAYKAEPFAPSSALMKAAKASDARVFKSNVPRAYELQALVKDYCANRRISVEQGAVDLLCESIGGPLSKLYGEINKLIAIVGNKGGKAISQELVRENIGNSKDFSNFELIDAIAAKDYSAVVKIVSNFQDNPKSHPTVTITPNIFTFFSNLVIAHYLPDKSDSALMKELGFKANVQLRTLRAGLRSYSAMQAVNAVHYLRDFDRKSKGVDSYQNEFALLRELIFKIFT